MKTTDFNTLNDLFKIRGGILKLPVSHLLIDDFKSHELLNEPFDINKSIKIIAAIDHDTPSGSESAAIIQKKIIAYAMKNNIDLYNGEGIGTSLLMENDLSKGDVVIGIEDDLTAVGAIGALGFNLEKDVLAAAAKSGFVTLDNFKLLGIELNGRLAKNVTVKDLVLTLYERLAASPVKDTILIFKDTSNQILSLDERITVCAHASSLGALSCIFTEASFQDIPLDETLIIDLSYIKSRIATEHSYKTIKSYSDINKYTLSQAFIGGISGGKIEDLRAVARVLKGNKLPGRTRMIIAPTTNSVFIEAMTEGLIHIFLDSGCVVMNQGYSADYGKSQGILTNNEVMISSGMRNQKGYIGPEDSKVFIASPVTVAKAAVHGYFGLE